MEQFFHQISVQSTFSSTLIVQLTGNKYSSGNADAALTMEK